jgi:transcription initiation factor TFIID TATA-box-binding protein
MIRIVGMVTICTLDKPLNLLYLSENIEGAVLPKSRKIWVKYRLKPDNYYIAFYKSGKFLINGVKSLEKTNDTANRVLKILENAGVHVHITRTEIVNIVCLSSFCLNKSLEKIICDLDSCDASYEPEQFPGLIYKKWGATFLIFSSGKVIITGLRDFGQAKILSEKLEKLLNF